MINEKNQPPKPRVIALWRSAENYKFSRESNCRLRFNWEYNNRLRLHAISGQFNQLRLPKKIVIDYDYPMSGTGILICWGTIEYWWYHLFVVFSIATTTCTLVARSDIPLTCCFVLTSSLCNLLVVCKFLLTCDRSFADRANHWLRI